MKNIDISKKLKIDYAWEYDICRKIYIFFRVLILCALVYCFIFLKRGYDYDAHGGVESVLKNETNKEYSLIITGFDKHYKYSRVMLKKNDEIIYMDVFCKGKNQVMDSWISTEVEWCNDKVIIKDKKRKIIIFYNGELCTDENNKKEED